MKRALKSLALIALLATGALGQHGGKAEPNRIIFAAGAVETTIRGSLRNGEEMEYVFAARKDQTVNIRNPATSMFDVRIFSDQFGVETEFESSREFSITVPADGDYMLFVRKKLTGGTARAKFAISLRIR